MKLIFEITVLDVTLPSVNRKFKGSPRFFAHKSYLVGLLMAAHDGGEPYGGEVRLVLTSITKKDFDASFKLIGDALEDAKIIEDDNLIRSNTHDIASRDTPIKGKDRVCIQVYAIGKDWYTRIKIKAMRLGLIS